MTDNDDPTPDPPATEPLDAVAVRSMLRALDLPVLAVTVRSKPWGRLLVYLHGNAGRMVQEEAVRVLRAHHGVQQVEVSASSSTILVVTLVRRENDSR
jgi:hypothetical protein